MSRVRLWHVKPIEIIMGKGSLNRPDCNLSDEPLEMRNAHPHTQFESGSVYFISLLFSPLLPLFVVLVWFCQPAFNPLTVFNLLPCGNRTLPALPMASPPAPLTPSRKGNTYTQIHINRLQKVLLPQKPRDRDVHRRTRRLAPPRRLRFASWLDAGCLRFMCSCCVWGW